MAVKTPRSVPNAPKHSEHSRPWLLGLLAVLVAVLGLAGCGVNDAPARASTASQSAGAVQPKATQTRVKPTRTPRPRATRTPTARPPTRTPAAKPSATATPEADDPFIIRDVSIYDQSGRLAYRGDVDLKPTLDRIDQGIQDSHRNDGAVFGNFEGRLPRKSRGYYHEYVLRTPGISGVGPQRLILGQDDEIYYTPDHYETFIQVK